MANANDVYEPEYGILISLRNLLNYYSCLRRAAQYIFGPRVRYRIVFIRAGKATTNSQVPSYTCNVCPNTGTPAQVQYNNNVVNISDNSGTAMAGYSNRYGVQQYGNCAIKRVVKFAAGLD